MIMSFSGDLSGDKGFIGFKQSDEYIWNLFKRNIYI